MKGFLLKTYLMCVLQFIAKIRIQSKKIASNIQVLFQRADIVIRKISEVYRDYR